MRKLRDIIFILITSMFCVFAQNEGNIWYFGYNAGLDFNSGVPVPLNDGQLWAFEGCASISDNNGDLLFYTDGTTIYNRNHAIMPNGTGLLGNSSSTQSGIIVKKPQSNTMYYVFTVDGITGGGGGLHYSEVDLTMQAGLGDVNANKNIQLFPSACEKVTAILHQNGTDFWIVSRLENSNTFHSYLLTSAGLNVIPVVTNIGPVYFGNYGYLKASPDGTKIAACWNFDFSVYDFDRNTGILSNEMIFPDAAYGAEFSPSGRFLYIAGEGSFVISQYNLLAGAYADILNSRIEIVNLSAGGGALQLAPDGKIYIAHTYDLTFSNVYNISVINNPNDVGFACDLDPFSVPIGNVGNGCGLGLPTFYSSIFVANTVDFVSLCYGDSTQFTSSNTSLDSVRWNFGDPNSGTNNTSTNANPYHIFSDTGNFDITLYSYLNNTTDTSITPVYINPLPFINLLADTSICDGDTLLLDVTLEGASYLWHDNSVSPNYNLFLEGDYSVTVTDTNGCVNIDTINALTYPLPNVNLGDDIEICEGDSILILDIYLENASYFWNNSSTTSSININTTGKYSVILTDSNGCSNSDTINVIINPLPNSDFTFEPQPTDLNNPEILFTNISPLNTSYQWNLGEGTIIDNLNNIYHTYQSSGKYDVSLISINQFGCIDTIRYQVVIDPGSFDLFIPNIFTPNNDQHNELLVVIGRYIIEFNIKIFDRSGTQIFESDQIDKYWDGRFEGELVQQDKYTYLVTVLDINGDVHEFSDIIHVIF